MFILREEIGQTEEETNVFRVLIYIVLLPYVIAFKPPNQSTIPVLSNVKYEETDPERGLIIFSTFNSLQKCSFGIRRGQFLLFQILDI